MNFVIDHLEGTLKMQVSRDKSNVVASKPSLALAVAERVDNNVVKAASHAKILGADTVGGARRCTFQFRSRIWQFLGKVPRFNALREVGANVHQMVRAVAAPSVLYAVECIGVSCAAIQKIRVAAARACSAKAGGKNVDLVWAAVDGNTGTADPAFEAHAGPMKYWALAFWESWFDDAELVKALTDARQKLNVKGKSIWGRVTGPATAFVVTMLRLKWT